MPILDKLATFGYVTDRATMANGREVVQALSLHPATPATNMRYFSGGNQQKAVIGKWLKRRQKIYIFSEPTTGVDVGAIRQIYEIMLEIAKDGASIILISTSFNELLSLCERIIVVHNGKVSVEAPRSDFTRDSLLAATLAADGVRCRMIYDLAVIGGGIVGTATALRYLQRHPDARIMVLEKEAEVARHQTGNNSGVIHAGVYYAPGSLKARLCRKGAVLMKEFCTAEGIEYEECGKLIVATDEVEVARLADLRTRAVANGIPFEEVART